VRGTQTLVDQMGWVFQRPALVALEVAWRWLFGVPFLAVCWLQAHAILRALPLDATGLTNLDMQNPWVAATQIASAWARYEPHVAAVFVWFLPAAVVAWCVVSGIGRALVFVRVEPGLRFRPLAMIALQVKWLALWCVVFVGWLSAMRWAAANHIAAAGEPDLIGFSIWTIFLSLAFFTLWALVSWPVAAAPVLLLGEDRTVWSSLWESLRLGRTLSAKLVETNLVMGIVKLALAVLAMVLSAAPLPFSDQLGPDAMHFVWLGAILFYLVASDYFHIVRMKGYIEFWRSLRGRKVRVR